MRKRGSIPFVRYFILCVPCVPCAPWFVNPLKRKGPTTENTEHTEMGIFSAFPSQRLRAEEADQQWKAENTRKRGSIPFVRYLILCVPCVLWFATHCRGKDQPRNTRKEYARLQPQFSAAAKQQVPIAPACHAEAVIPQGEAQLHRIALPDLA